MTHAAPPSKTDSQAVNAQTMARIWRDGQSRPCTVYRLHAVGGMDEKLLQRLHHKAQLECALADGGAAAVGGASRQACPGGAFTREQLRELFSLDARTTCGTRDLMLGGPHADAWRERAAAGGEAVLQAAEGTGRVTWVHRWSGQVAAAPAEEGAGGVGGGGEEEGATKARVGDGVEELEVADE